MLTTTPKRNSGEGGSAPVVTAPSPCARVGDAGGRAGDLRRRTLDYVASITTANPASTCSAVR